MRQFTGKKLRPLVSRSAFTLVEMLVSVTLVLMMMTLFASIFQMATGSMTTQRGIAENDQRARALTTVIRKDFQHRTFRYPFAYYPGEDSATSPTSFSNRSGYLYISTNDPNSGLDDIIQYTVSANILSEDPDGTPYFGNTVALRDRRTDIAIPAAQRVSLAVNPNQPETDDGSITANFVGSSSAAEVCYFVRHGNLYRRVLLIREPLAFAGQNLAPQPTSQSGYNYFSGQPDVTAVGSYDGLFEPVGGPVTNDFYRLFDYSAFATAPGGLQQTSFVGVASLSNQTAGAAGDVVANPQRRFGFNPFTGLSREHNMSPAVGVPLFIGRFLQAETSTLNFNWPQGVSTNEPAIPTNPLIADLAQLTGTNGNPLDLVASPLALNPGNGLVTSFDASQPAGIEGRGGIRRMEDLLLANVHEMKVEIWDDRLGRYVTPGHSSQNPVNGQRGDYHISRCLNHDFRVVPGAVGAPLIGKIFDTWHPAIGIDFDGGGTVTPVERNSPYIPYSFYPPLPPFGPPIPTHLSVPLPLNPAAEDSRNRGYWAMNTSYNLNDVVFVPWIDAPSLAPPGPPDGVFQYPEMAEPKFHIAYRCITAGTSNGSPELNWPTAQGRQKTEGGGSTVRWESFDNRRPLRSIRLQIRFQDKTTDTLRQLSLVIPMTEVK